MDLSDIKMSKLDQRNQQLCILGFGTLGRYIVSGILDAMENSKNLDQQLDLPKKIIGCVRTEDSKIYARSVFGEKVDCCNGNNVEAVKNSDVVVLACKPYAVNDILSETGIYDALRNKTLISICAGITINEIKSFVHSSTNVFRVMPNTPVKIRHGTSVIAFCKDAPERDLVLVKWIFERLGSTIFLDESHFDAATALVGSGPAFIAVLLEAMIDGAVMMGMPRKHAEKMAALTMLGTSKMVLSGEGPSKIRNDVATPGGCTIGGLLAMEDGKIRSILARAIQEATEIARSLGK